MPRVPPITSTCPNVPLCEKADRGRNQDKAIGGGRIVRSEGGNGGGRTHAVADYGDGNARMGGARNGDGGAQVAVDLGQRERAPADHGDVEAELGEQAGVALADRAVSHDDRTACPHLTPMRPRV